MLPKKNYTYYFEQAIYFFFFFVKFRILLKFYYNIFDSNLSTGNRSFALGQMIKFF